AQALRASSWFGWGAVALALLFLVSIAGGLVEQAGTLRPWAQKVADMRQGLKISAASITIVLGFLAALCASVWLFGPYRLSFFGCMVAAVAVPVAVAV